MPKVPVSFNLVYTCFRPGFLCVTGLKVVIR